MITNNTYKTESSLKCSWCCLIYWYCTASIKSNPKWLSFSKQGENKWLLLSYLIDCQIQVLPNYTVSVLISTFQLSFTQLSFPFLYLALKVVFSDRQLCRKLISHMLGLGNCTRLYHIWLYCNLCASFSTSSINDSMNIWLCLELLKKWKWFNLIWILTCFDFKN